MQHRHLTDAHYKGHAVSVACNRRKHEENGSIISNNITSFQTASVVQWSEFLATDPEVRVRFPALPETKIVVGLERGPLSPVSTTEELLDRKVAAPV
jgi:hypothetical protein